MINNKTTKTIINKWRITKEDYKFAQKCPRVHIFKLLGYKVREITYSQDKKDYMRQVAKVNVRVHEMTKKLTKEIISEDSSPKKLDQIFKDEASLLDQKAKDLYKDKAEKIVTAYKDEEFIEKIRNSIVKGKLESTKFEEPVENRGMYGRIDLTVDIGSPEETTHGRAHLRAGKVLVEVKTVKPEKNNLYLKSQMWDFENEAKFYAHITNCDAILVLPMVQEVKEFPSNICNSSEEIDIIQQAELNKFMAVQGLYPSVDRVNCSGCQWKNICEKLDKNKIPDECYPVPTIIGAELLESGMCVGIDDTKVLEQIFRNNSIIKNWGSEKELKNYWSKVIKGMHEMKLLTKEKHEFYPVENNIKKSKRYWKLG